MVVVVIVLIVIVIVVVVVDVVMIVVVLVAVAVVAIVFVVGLADNNDIDEVIIIILVVVCDGLCCAAVRFFQTIMVPRFMWMHMKSTGCGLSALRAYHNHLLLSRPQQMLLIQMYIFAILHL